MAARAEGTFTVKSWDEDTYQELDGKAKLSRASVTFAYSGDLQAEGGWTSLMYYRDDGTAVYTGLERIVGQLGGRSGSFVLRSDGTAEEGEARTSWQVVDGSGTGELAGLRGEGRAVANSPTGGPFTLDYDID